jgi:hypothetical protein
MVNLKKRSDKKLSAREISYLILAGIVAILALATLIAANVSLAQKIGSGGEFLLPWKAARAFLFEHIDSYGGEVANYVQQQVYGHSARAGDEPYFLDMPFFLLLPYFSFGLFQDPSLARGLYLAVSEIGLLALAYSSLRLTDWQPRRLFTISFYVFSALGFYSLLALLESTPAILLGLTYAAILLALRYEADELAGALLAVSFSHWEIGGLFIFLMFLRVFYQKRWRVLYGFLLYTFALVVLAFFARTDWIFPFIVGLLANLRAAYGFSAGAVFIHLWPEIGSNLGWALTVIAAIVLGFEWNIARRADFRRFYWTACLTLAVTPLIGVRTQLENLVVLIIPLAFVFAIARERWQAGYWLSGALLATLFSLPWVLFLGGFLAPQLRDDLLFLFLPVVTVIGLYWIRWWAIRPPQTWTERAIRSEYR